MNSRTGQVNHAGRFSGEGNSMTAKMHKGTLLSDRNVTYHDWIMAYLDKNY